MSKVLQTDKIPFDNNDILKLSRISLSSLKKTLCLCINQGTNHLYGSHQCLFKGRPVLKALMSSADSSGADNSSCSSFTVCSDCAIDFLESSVFLRKPCGGLKAFDCFEAFDQY
ncbi:hypothetical protein CS542_01230 [Pedobacter sp. IW39]|nr:hypothetical protein CS542_01230 [Pedobacter sp. IW39]